MCSQKQNLNFPLAEEEDITKLLKSSSLGRMKTATTASLLSTHTQKKPREPWQEPNCGVVVPAHTPWNYDLNMSYETSNQPTSQKNSLPEWGSGPHEEGCFYCQYCRVQQQFFFIWGRKYMQNSVLYSLLQISVSNHQQQHI